MGIFRKRVVICCKDDIKHMKIAYFMQKIFLDNNIDCYIPIHNGLDMFSKNFLMENHFSKIDISDTVIGLSLHEDGHYGEHTKMELDHASSLGKDIWQFVKKETEASLNYYNNSKNGILTVISNEDYIIKDLTTMIVNERYI